MPIHLVAELRSFLTEQTATVIPVDKQKRAFTPARKYEYLTPTAPQPEPATTTSATAASQYGDPVLTNHSNSSGGSAVIVREAPVSAPIYRAAYLDNPNPGYPLAARRRGQEGTVNIEALVSRDGRAVETNVKTSSGVADLDESALTAVRHWRFVPAKRGDEPIEAWVTVPIRFQLDNPSGAL